MMNPRTLGIDLGTSNSSGAVAVDRNEITMVESRDGRTAYGKSFPSFVLFDHHGERQHVGQKAKDQLSINPKLVVWGVKRLVGLSYEKASRTGEFKRFQYDIEEGEGGMILIRVGPKLFSPSAVLEQIIREIKADAEDPATNPTLGGPFDRVVISVPAYFDATRTGPIIEAAKRAGFPQVNTIAEPLAAAVRYSLKVDRESLVMAFDLGGGTLDVSLLQIVAHHGELIPGGLSVSGHEALGGMDMDDALAAYLVNKYGLEGLPGRLREWMAFRQDVERAKIKLSTRQQATIESPYGDLELSRAECESAIASLLAKCRGPIQVALQEAGFPTAAAIDHVIFIGGPTYMPCVRKTVYEELQGLGARPEVLALIAPVDHPVFPVSPTEAVAQGAALKAAQVVDPTVIPVAEGWGTSLGQYYAEIIPPGSTYPYPKTNLEIQYGDPNAKRVSVRVVTKRPDPERTAAARRQFKYELKGEFDLALSPTGQLPKIQVTFAISEERELICGLSHQQTGHQVRYERLDTLAGRELDLQEGQPPAQWTNEDRKALEGGFDTKAAAWTVDELKKLLRIATAARELGARTAHLEIEAALLKVEQAAGRALASGYASPDTHGPEIQNRVLELLHLLRAPGVGAITEEEYQGYMQDLRRGIH